MGWILSGILFWSLFVVVTLLAWITHIVNCFTDDQWGFLIAGALFFPLGIIHGVGIWFGWW